MSTVAERNAEMLQQLTHEWQSTFELGGQDASHHSHTCKRLWKLGLVERKRNPRHPSYWVWRLA